MPLSIICRVWVPNLQTPEPCAVAPPHWRFHPWTEWVSVGGCSGLCERTRQGEAVDVVAKMPSGWSSFIGPSSRCTITTIFAASTERLVARYPGHNNECGNPCSGHTKETVAVDPEVQLVECGVVSSDFCRFFLQLRSEVSSHCIFAE